MMKLVLKFLLIVFALSLSGCFKVEMNSVVKTDGTIDMNATYDLSALKGLGAFGGKMKFDCEALSKNDFVKPNDCKEVANGVFSLQWDSVNGQNFEALRVSNSQIFKTRYELNVKNFMKNFEPDFENSDKQKDLNVIKNTGATYKLNVTMPGTILSSSDYQVIGNSAQVDIFAIYSTPKNYVIVSEKYNYWVIFGILILLGGTGAFVFLRKNENKIIKFSPLAVAVIGFAIFVYGLMSKESAKSNQVGLEENMTISEDVGPKYIESNLSTHEANITETNQSAMGVIEPSSDYASKEQQEIVTNIQTTRGISGAYTLLKIQSNDFAIADKALNDSYKALVARISPEEQEELKVEQLEWIKLRDNRAVEASQKGWAHLQNVLVSTTNERMQNLSKR